MGLRAACALWQRRMSVTRKGAEWGKHGEKASMAGIQARTPQPQLRFGRQAEKVRAFCQTLADEAAPS